VLIHSFLDLFFCLFHGFFLYFLDINIEFCFLSQDDLANNNDVIRGTSYAKLAAEIDVLVEEMERVQQHGSTNALTALLRTTIAPVSPTNTPAVVESVPTYDTGLYGSLLGEQSLGTFNQFQYTAPAPVFQAAEPVFQASVADSRPAVPIAHTLPEFDEPIVEEPEEQPSEEETGHEEPEEETVHIEEIIDEVFPAVEVVPEEVVTASAAEAAHKNRLNKNVRVRGDPSRAARKAEDAKKHAARPSGTHHYEAATASTLHHHEPEPKTFRDRLLSRQSHTTTATASAPAPAAATVEAAQEGTPADDAADKRMRAPRSNTKKDETAPASAAAADKTKSDRNTRVRSRRPDDEAASADEATADTGKKWSAIAANATAPGDSAAPETEDKKPRKSSPNGERSARPRGDKPVARPRREKKEDAPTTAVHDAPAAPQSVDGFQSVSRRTAPSAGAAAKNDSDKKRVRSTPGDKAPVKKPVAPAASK
jgi:hypothetical protein